MEGRYHDEEKEGFWFWVWYAIGALLALSATVGLLSGYLPWQQY